MRTLVQQRCFNHSWREAAARCPECSRYFCRECVTEHDDRVLCAGCLRRRAEARGERRAGLTRWLRAGWRSVQVGLGILALWLFFHLLGAFLVSLPGTFHEGTFWQQTASEP